ncbi:hypothetical protein SAMN05444162_1409 [Paenibacillaceae bacterium GAS479]|nr:hypothetical protein SAMN05444162_1409 [Paenibacillaceae bacterium GAS479]
MLKGRGIELAVQPKSARDLILQQDKFRFMDVSSKKS